MFKDVPDIPLYWIITYWIHRIANGSKFKHNTIWYCSLLMKVKLVKSVKYDLSSRSSVKIMFTPVSPIQEPQYHPLNIP